MLKKAQIIFFFILAINLVPFSGAQETNQEPVDDEIQDVTIPLDVICEEVRARKDEPDFVNYLMTPSTYDKPMDIISCNLNNSSVKPETGAVNHLIHQLAELDNFSLRKEYLEACDLIDKYSQIKPEQDPPVIILQDQEDRKWRFKFYFGNTKTFYNKTTATIKTSRLNLKVQDLEPYERRSDSYYRNFFHESAQEMLQIFDEPTNTFTFFMAKNKNQIVLKIFHPKWVFTEGNQDAIGHHYNENVLVNGTKDGTKIDEHMHLNAAFDPTTHLLLPGYLGISNWEDSHKLLQVEAGYGREFTLLKSQGKPILKYTPQVLAGVYLGVKNSSIVGKYGYIWDIEEYGDGSNSNAGIKIMGYSASLAQRLDFNNRKDSAGIFVEHKISYGKMDYGFLDGNVKHELNYSSLTVGVSLKIQPRKNYQDIKKTFTRKKPAELPEDPMEWPSDEQSPDTSQETSKEPSKAPTKP